MAEAPNLIGSPKHEIHEIGILVYDGVNDLDMIGPRYVLGQIMGARTRLISVAPGSVTTVMGTVVVPDVTIVDIDSLDLLIVPGGVAGTVEAMYNEEVQDWIRRIDDTTTYTAGVCTGGWILAASGLLDGRRATTNWYRAEEMLSKYGAKFTGERYSSDGKYWTSAGVTAGLDMSLAILVDLYGAAYAQAIMLDMEYDPAPPVAGGTPANTPPAVLSFMKSMYDAGVLPALEHQESSARQKEEDPGPKN